MTTRADATLALARILGNVVESTSTGGSTTTLIDTTRLETDLYFKGGTIWFQSGDNDGVSKKVTDYDLATTTFTFAAVTAIGAGVTYAAAPSDFPRDVLIQGINEAIRELPSRDTSLTTVQDQNEYSLPAGVYNVKHVEIASRKSSPYEYIPSYQWQELDSKLVFDPLSYPTEAGYIIRLTYVPAISELSADSSTLNSVDHLDAIKWRAAVYCLRWKIQRVKGDEQQFYTGLLNEALQNAERYSNKWPVPMVFRAPKHSSW